MRVYFFGKNSDLVSCSDKAELLGGKGASLHDMSMMGIPVPPGVIIPTTECISFNSNNKTIPKSLRDNVISAIRRIELQTGRKFGCKSNPLLLSVRSGAKVSMPGMMDTVLNIGISDGCIANLGKFGDKSFALDCYRRFIQMYGNVVLGIPSYKFEDALLELKMSLGITKDSDMQDDNWSKFISIAYEIVRSNSAQEIPSDPYDQLFSAISAVFNSCDNERAKIYRKIHNMSETPSTAVNIQSMVFGNLNNRSATGVLFTRSPSTGVKELYGEYIINAQGEDVVSGSRLPASISKGKNPNGLSMQELMPAAFLTLQSIAKKLEIHYKDMQDIEFTIENDVVWILQTRSGKRAAKAAIKIARDMVLEKLITKEDALLKVNPDNILKVLHAHPVSGYKLEQITSGLPASPGIGTGKVVFSSLDAEKQAKDGNDVILIREETSPEDVKGMHLSKAVLTCVGGTTSHAAVVARGMGVPCVVGCSGIIIDYRNKQLVYNNGRVIKEGDIISVDGFSGVAVIGKIPMEQAAISKEFDDILRWSDEIAVMKVRCNTETVSDLENAIRFGATGVGLVRTEHMFFDSDALFEIRTAIVLQGDNRVDACMQRITDIQRGDFEKLFALLNDMPVNIRLLDPPLHEFLPKKEEDIQHFCERSGVSLSVVRSAIEKLKESNPMLGFRGCRLGILIPKLYLSQLDAVFGAYINSINNGIRVKLEIMIPLIQSEKELSYLVELLIQRKAKFEASSGIQIDCKVGSMIELPRACLVSDKLAQHVDYFSFGTNDLTQTTFGISRDDGESFLPGYERHGIFDQNPFVEIDRDGVGSLMKLSIDKGRSIKEGMHFGICGEHGGNPESIRFACELGINYVSCSPYRIPIARLVAAQYAIEQKR